MLKKYLIWGFSNNTKQKNQNHDTNQFVKSTDITSQGMCPKTLESNTIYNSYWDFERKIGEVHHKKKNPQEACESTQWHILLLWAKAMALCDKYLET